MNQDLNGGLKLTHYNEKLPKEPLSYWRTNIEFPKFPKLEQDIDVDVVIVGAGITGITSAYLLVNEGLKVAVIESDEVLNGTTGHTTAKITAQHDLIYAEFMHSLGREKAGLYYQANSEALNFIKETVDRHSIECEFSPQDAYIYSTSEKYAKKIEKKQRLIRFRNRRGIVGHDSV